MVGKEEKKERIELNKQTLVPKVSARFGQFF